MRERLRARLRMSDQAQPPARSKRNTGMEWRSPAATLNSLVVRSVATPSPRSARKSSLNERTYFASRLAESRFGSTVTKTPWTCAASAPSRCTACPRAARVSGQTSGQRV